MAAPNTTIWELEPHSRAKHEILKRYLQAYMAILGQRFPEVVYIDGFAGPGRYSKGEDGSPVIALKAALEHQARIRSKVTFLFVERDEDRANMLNRILDEIECPRQFSVRVFGSTTFKEAITNFLDEYARRGQRLPPTFAFIDPFGWGDVPFQLVQRILSLPNCEALITFMYEEINRFLAVPQQVQNFDTFFGTDKWRELTTLNDPKKRNRCLHDLYLHQLHVAARTQYVRSFEMRNDRDVTDYYLFYATNNFLGLKKMKEAMWRVDPSGEFRFSDATDPHQLVLFGRDPQFDILKQQVTDRFQGQETTIREIEEFVVSETAFRETHYKGILKELETSRPPGLMAIGPSANRNVGTYARPFQRVQFT